MPRVLGERAAEDVVPWESLVLGGVRPPRVGAPEFVQQVRVRRLPSGADAARWHVSGVDTLARSGSCRGAERIGTGVLGGMIAATLLAVLFVPLWFFLLRRERKPAASPRVAAAAPSPAAGRGPS
jgi:hypothetical protein